MAHQYETEIRAFLSGVELQFDHARDGTGWDNFDPERHDHAAVCLLAGNKTQYQFRIKPRTVKIGSREVEAPVLEPVAGQTLFVFDRGLWKAKQAIGPRPDPDFLKAGIYFSSPEAATAAHEAVAALMRGEA